MLQRPAQAWERNWFVYLRPTFHNLFSSSTMQCGSSHSHKRRCCELCPERWRCNRGSYIDTKIKSFREVIAKTAICAATSIPKRQQGSSVILILFCKSSSGSLAGCERPPNRTTCPRVSALHVTIHTRSSGTSAGARRKCGSRRATFVHIPKGAIYSD